MTNSVDPGPTLFPKAMPILVQQGKGYDGQCQNTVSIGHLDTAQSKQWPLQKARQALQVIISRQPASSRCVQVPMPKHKQYGQPPS